MPLPCPLAHGGGEPLLRRLADQIRVTRSGELLMGLRKHFSHKTGNALRFFP
jgi:hypothetical protein